MSALNTDTNRIFETPNDTNSLPVATGSLIYEGSLVGRTETGYARALQAGDISVGFSKDHIDNVNGADGEKNCEVKAKGKVSLFISGITLSDVGSKVYASDDNTFILTETNNSLVGKLVRFERSDYGIVAFDFLSTDETTTQEEVVEEQAEEPVNEGE